MSNKYSSDHMANERTFLAWIRTSIGIMAFGFVLEKFSLFVQQMKVFASHANIEHTFPKESDLSGITGFILVILGALATVMAFIKFRLTSRQIDNDNYKPLYIFDIIIAVSVLVVAIFLIVYLSPDLSE